MVWENLFAALHKQKDSYKVLAQQKQFYLETHKF